MNLTEKLDNFLSQNPIITKVLEESCVKGRGLNAVFFESDAKLSSPVYGNYVFIGAYSYMNNGGYIRSNSFIGRFCSIGRRVTIAAGNHPYDGVSTHPILKKSGYKSSNKLTMTIINNDVWVGDGSIIMPGVNIGQGAVIGANSVVTRDIPPYSIAVGQPCRPIKYRFSKLKIDYLLSNDIFDQSIQSIKNLNSILVMDDKEFINSFVDWADDSIEYDTFAVV